MITLVIQLLRKVSPLVFQASCVRFEVASTEERCIFDVLRKDQLVTGEFEVHADGDDVNMDIHVTGPLGEEVFSKQNSKMAKFGFTAEAAGEHVLCLRNNDMITREVQVKLRSGVEAKDLTEVVQRHHLKPLSAEVIRIQETIRDVRHELTALKQREAEMRDMNESINTRVSLFSFFSIAVVGSLGAWQIMYLKSYFQRKKLI
ncbi:Transmembrane emp24 domain-containing protein [Hondaea fermentalgiana]|uniref:Transmembrane emp24 domain-containing protein n=1 Tax=Hondaea fermentalgiana TaxID=2315210 RepID=A0A2R5GX12_9STRA|nr:Transmembrane emp24 domain-containing protein [Hondaea fermentalgiana]|eukprot:GBG32951.1 Transmembrane emp24 domain-containing protein [Hondaea fermentalgiana]